MIRVSAQKIYGVTGSYLAFSGEMCIGTFRHGLIPGPDERVVPVWETKLKLGDVEVSDVHPLNTDLRVVVSHGEKALNDEIKRKAGKQ